jgi:hypothetical protein
MTRATVAFWSALKVTGVACHLALLILLMSSIAGWEAFGLWAFLDTGPGRQSLAVFFGLLGLAYYMTAKMHPRPAAFQVAGTSFEVLGVIIIGVATVDRFMGRPPTILFDTGYGRLALFVGALAPNLLGGALNRPVR